MCLIWGLTEANKDKAINEERHINTDIIASFYSQWINSKPFDVERTAENSLKALLMSQKAYSAKNISYAENGQSLTNATLKKCAPMAVWASALLTQ